jgi:multisubunit Na+/H+ antiporter MnhB subunit
MKTIATGILCLTFHLNSTALAAAPPKGGTLASAESAVPRRDTSLSMNNSDKKHMRRLRRTAISAIVMSFVTAGLYAASDVMFFYDHDTPGGAMGLTGLGLTAGLTPLFHLSNRSAYRHFGVSGVRPLQVWGWVASGLAVADVLGVVVAGYGAAVNPMYGLISLAGLFTAMGFSLFAVDGLHARRELRTFAENRRSARRPAWSPFVSGVPSADRHHRGALFGVTGAF